MSTSCEFNFINNPERVYYAGELLKGTVHLSLKSKTTVRGVYVEIYGKAYAHWTKTHYERDYDGEEHRYTRYYYGEESYLGLKEYFIGGTSGNV